MNFVLEFESDYEVFGWTSTQQPRPQGLNKHPTGIRNGTFVI